MPQSGCIHRNPSLEVVVSFKRFLWLFCRLKDFTSFATPFSANRQTKLEIHRAGHLYFFFSASKGRVSSTGDAWPTTRQESWGKSHGYANQRVRGGSPARPSGSHVLRTHLFHSMRAHLSLVARSTQQSIMLTSCPTHCFSLSYSWRSEVRSGAPLGEEWARSLASRKIEHMELFEGKSVRASVQACTHKGKFVQG